MKALPIFIIILYAINTIFYAYCDNLPASLFSFVIICSVAVNPLNYTRSFIEKHPTGLI